MSRSVVFGFAVDQWRVIRTEFEIYREHAYIRAENATRGALLNARGRAKQIDPWSLFIGSDVRALAYASEELRDHWAEYPRITFADFERQWFEREDAS